MARLAEGRQKATTRPERDAPSPARRLVSGPTAPVPARRRCLAIGMQTAGLALRHALEDLWADAAVNRRWQRVALQLTEADAERLVKIASRRGLGGRSWQWLPRATATEGWALATDGYAGPRPGWARAKPPVKSAAGAPATISRWSTPTSTCSSSVPALPVPR